jgi:hypothetical protein
MNPVQSLKLTPLDRVLVRQSVYERDRCGLWEDWRYFQTTLPDGRLLVATPGGSKDAIAWDQVESIEKREPLTVRAKAKHQFSIPFEAMTDWYPATVLGAVFKTDGGLSGFEIQLDNGDVWGSATGLVIHHDDFANIETQAQRGLMPVSQPFSCTTARAAGKAAVQERTARNKIHQLIYRRAIKTNPAIDRHNKEYRP